MQTQDSAVSALAQVNNQYFVKGVMIVVIKFSWDTGWMEINAEHVIESMSMTNYRKWAKLFAKYGTPEQHKEYLQLVNTYIENQEAKCADLENKVAGWQAMADGRLPTEMTLTYWQRQVKLYKRHLNSAKTKLKRYKTVYQVLEGLVT